MEHSKQLAELLASKDWDHVNQGFELARSLDPAQFGSDLIRSLVPDDEELAAGELDVQVWVAAWEDDIEACTFTAGEQTWYGGVQHGFKTGIYFSFASTDQDALSTATACIKADHWDSAGVSDDLPWEYPDSGNGKSSEAFYWNKEGDLVDGEPEPEDETESIERDYTDGMGGVYSASWGFGDSQGCEVTLTDEDGNEVTIDSENNRAVLLALSLAAGVDLNDLPTIDMEARDKELRGLRESVPEE